MFRRWEAPLSEIRDLFFHRLIDEGKGKFEVETKEGILFEVLLGEKTGPYLIVEEEHLTKYWNLIPEGLGRSFMIDESEFFQLFPGVMNPSEFTHYVVSTWSICLKMLSREAPEIRKVN